MKFKNNIERLDTKEIVDSNLINWDFFRNKTIMVTGATGLIGSQLVKTFLYANANLNTNINILALARSKTKVKELFPKSKNKELIKFIYQDITEELKFNKKADFIIHTANSTSSASFVEKPVETIDSIVQGTLNVLDYAKRVKSESVVYLSSMEVYGNIPLTRIEPLKEEDYGYLDILKVRSSYQEGKRAAECLCAAYAKEFSLPVKIARLAQTIGAGVDYNDNRVFAQFARNIVEKQDIILKTKGETVRSYCYITDAVVAILLMLEKGANGESYNVANSETTCSIKEMAEMLCNKYPSSNFAIQLEENKQYLGTLKYYLSSEKLQNKTGWSANVNLEEAFRRLIDSFYYQKNKIINLSNRIIKKEKRGYSLLEQIFSFKNTSKHKVIRILGLDLKINRQLLFKKYYNLPIEDTKISFINFGGNGYGCNPKYIAEEIIKQKLPYKLVWLTKSNIDTTDFPKEIEIVNFRSKHAIREIITSKYIISNVRLNNLIERGWVKRKRQVYIQTWHGSLGIKKIDADVKGKVFTGRTQWCETAHVDSKYTDCLLSNSAFEDNVFKNGFWYDGEIKRIGHPRNDLFFISTVEQQKIKEKVYNTLGINKSKKIFIYAPSFRDDFRLDCYMLDTQALKQVLEGRFGGEWCILIRMHPRLASVSNVIFEYNESVINASYYSDIQELLLASDIAMTDYSSCIFDFMLSRKPAFIFATDIEDFNTERGFYYPLETTPFPVAINNFDLIAKIKTFDEKKYKEEVEKFLKEKGCMEDGQASKRVVEFIKG